ncbi:MAG: hypothetical protein LBU11_12515 [Zoogloeaceae bacterium]|nr:hypothetical protein [Zoogloeaceae bacterium]
MTHWHSKEEEPPEATPLALIVTDPLPASKLVSTAWFSRDTGFRDNFAHRIPADVIKSWTLRKELMNCNFDLKLHNAIDETLFSQWHVLQPALATHLSGDKEAARAMWLRKLDELAKDCRALLGWEEEDE